MAVETELKLSVSPEHLSKLRRHPLLKSLSASRAVTQKLYSVYYDTPDLQLRKRGVALRLRRAGKQWLQTLKGGGGVQAGLHRRNEWETPVSSEALDLASLKAAGGKLPADIAGKLQPVFLTEFTRSIRLLMFEEAEIALCLDSGVIQAGKKTHPISELELELKSGEPQQLFRLALLLCDAVPLEIENTSKAEYGYRLFSGEVPGVRKVAFPQLDESQSMASALWGIIAACLGQVQANVPSAVERRDEEYLHQVRVGLRRLRVVLAMTERLHAETEVHDLHEEVAKLCTELGGMREWDVFITQTLAPFCSHQLAHGGLFALLKAGERRREQCHLEIVDLLKSQDYQRLQLRFGAWLHGDYWTTLPEEKNLKDFAAGILKRRHEQVNRRGEEFDAPARLHALRIACKKLRYSAEAFASLYPREKTGHFIGALTRLQDVLGEMNDLSIAKRLVEELEVQASAEAIALVRAQIEHEQAALAAELPKAWKRFSRRSIFW